MVPHGLSTGETLASPRHLASLNGRFFMRMQDDGNLVREY